jgi:hypothetical protein
MKIINYVYLSKEDSMQLSRNRIIVGGILLLLITAACGISFDSGDDEPSEAEQTLQALYAQGTADALAT